MNQTDFYIDCKVKLEAEIAKLRREIDAMPPGYLTVYTRRIKGKEYHSYYKELTCDGEKVRLYIPKQKISEAKILAHKTYKSRLLKDKENELKCINYFLKHRIVDHFSELYYPSSPYSSLLSDGITEPELWEKEPYNKSTEHPEHLIIKAPKGEFVRSKSEAMIAQSLFSKRIPYRYENIHEIDNYPIATDFTIMHPRTGKIILWEHFGLADNPDYQRKIEFKLIKYLKAGYLPGHNMIITFEDSAHPLSFIEIEEIVKKYFS